jgi:hypothetical protein
VASNTSPQIPAKPTEQNPAEGSAGDENDDELEDFVPAIEEQHEEQVEEM